MFQVILDYIGAFKLKIQTKPKQESKTGVNHRVHLFYSVFFPSLSGFYFSKTASHSILAGLESTLSLRSMPKLCSFCFYLLGAGIIDVSIFSVVLGWDPGLFLQCEFPAS